MKSAIPGRLTPAFTHEELVRQLLRPEAYLEAEKVSNVRLVQTHISSLFFTGRYVYKVKRPVNYGFLDFTTLAKRRYYCRREVALNRRLSPQVYVGVVEVREQDGQLSINGPGRAVEYAVKMRQLPGERSLSMLLREGVVCAQDMRRVAELIADFHHRAGSSLAITRQGGLEAVRRNVEENFRQTRQHIGGCLAQDAYDDLVAYSRAFMDAQAETFARRAEEGRIRDGHGDLQAADIFLADGVQVLDCIEFNRRFRYGDVASDVAFLAMDLDFHGCSDLSEAFIQAYVEASGDTGVWEFLDFFKAYRAYVRAKVNSFRLDDTSLSGEERERIWATAREYYQLAHSYTRVIPRPSLFVVAGLLGTGKSTIGEQLARRWDAMHISSDVTRKALVGISVGEHRYETYDQGIYAGDISRRTYEAMLAQAREELKKDKAVILDATFRSAAERQRAVDLAQEVGAELWIVECVTSPPVVKRRVKRRVSEGTSASDARWELYYQQQAEWEPVAEVPPRRYIRLDTSRSVQKVVQQLLYRLYLSVLS